jgi:hypothetical protein
MSCIVHGSGFNLWAGGRPEPRSITASGLLQQVLWRVLLSIGSSSTLFQMTFERERAMMEARLQPTTATSEPSTGRRNKNRLESRQEPFSTE